MSINTYHTSYVTSIFIRCIESKHNRSPCTVNVPLFAFCSLLTVRSSLGKESIYRSIWINGSTCNTLNVRTCGPRNAAFGHVLRRCSGAQGSLTTLNRFSHLSDELQQSTSQTRSAIIRPLILKLCSSSAPYHPATETERKERDIRVNEAQDVTLVRRQVCQTT